MTFFNKKKNKLVTETRQSAWYQQSMWWNGYIRKLNLEKKTELDNSGTRQIRSGPPSAPASTVHCSATQASSFTTFVRAMPAVMDVGREIDK